MDIDKLTLAKGILLCKCRLIMLLLSIGEVHGCAHEALVSMCVYYNMQTLWREQTNIDHISCPQSVPLPSFPVSVPYAHSNR